jgi:hypothetical protein
VSYQPYPTAGGTNQLPKPAGGPQPKTLVNAVRLMWAGGGLALVGTIMTLVLSSKIKDALGKALVKDNVTLAREGRTVLTTAQIHSVQSATVVGLAAFTIISAGLWAWMARANNGGRNWARIVATVLFGLMTILLPVLLPRGGVSLVFIFVLLEWLIGLVATVLLWLRDTTAYVKAQRL